MTPPSSFAARIRRALFIFGACSFLFVSITAAVLKAWEQEAEYSQDMVATISTCKELIKDYLYQYDTPIKSMLASLPAGREAGIAELSSKLNLRNEDLFYILDKGGSITAISSPYKGYQGLNLSHIDFIKEKKPVSEVHQSLFHLRPVVSMLYSLPQEKLLIVERDLQGIIPLVKHFNTSRFLGQSAIFILSRDGIVVSHPDEELVKSRHNLGFELKEWNGSTSGRLRTYTYRGNKYLSYKESLESPSGWTMYYSLPYSLLSTAITQAVITQSLIIAALFLILTALLNYLINYRLSRPINTISKHLSHCNPVEAEGDIPDDMACNILELSQIIQATNTMVQNIRRSNEQLVKSEELFRTVTEFASDWIYWLSPEGNLIYVSPACEQITGYSPHAFYESPELFHSLIYPDDRVPYETHIHEAIDDAKPESIEFRIVAKDGSVRWIRHMCKPIHTASGAFLGVRGSNADITARRQAEELLAAEKEQLSITLRSIGDGVITTDTEGRVVLINKVAESLTGWTHEDAFGRPVEEIFRIINEKTREQCEDPVQKVLKTGRIIGLANHTALIARDGTERIIADSGAPIRDKDSNIIGVVLVFRDITEKQKMEEEILKAHKIESLGILAGGIAHDFNNILTAVLGNISLAQEYVAPEDKAFEKLTVAEKATLKAKDLVQQLLTFSKGGAPIKKTASIAEIIKDSSCFVLRGSNVKCEFDLPDALWAAEVDEGQISQVINNLIINADQAMPKGGVIRIHAENAIITSEETAPLSKGRYIKIAITDEGSGIPDEYSSKVFDPYFTTKEKGSGLGLATAFSIIKRHDGHITLTSRQGAGTTFTIYLPASENPIAEKKEKEETLYKDHSRHKILVMDDEETVRDIASEMLRQLGYKVTCADDGQEAFELYEAAMGEGHPFNAVIMDLTIPGGMGGKELIRKLYEIDPLVSAIVSSGYSNNPVMADYKTYGFSGVIVKPYKLEDLKSVVLKVLGT